VYPTVRRKAAIIGEPQRGANCQLSAVTGLPALSIPAGFTPDGLPIAAELIGRPLADARLVSLAYDYEQSSRPRLPPSTTPPLVNGRAPKPSVLLAVARSGASVARGEFAFDPTLRTLDYIVRVTGTPAERVLAITIDRDSAGKKGPILRHLSNAGSNRTTGSIKLSEVERRALLTGNLSLVVYTSDHPAGTQKGTIGYAPRP